MGTLYIVSTPIGNLEDITLRALQTLKSVDIIACEDTRRTGLFLQHYNIKTSMVRFDDATEQKKTPELISTLESGKSVALVSDAGTPLVNDPGFVLVRECIKRAVHVVSVPGPTAAIAALTVSGLPTDKFLFLGYPPEKKSHRIKLFTTLPKETTIIFYCAPHKLLQTLADLKETLGDMEISVCRELTKTYEDSWTGTISEALTHFLKVKGEVVLLLHLKRARV